MAAQVNCSLCLGPRNRSHIGCKWWLCVWSERFSSSCSALCYETFGAQIKPNTIPGRLQIPSPQIVGEQATRPPESRLIDSGKWARLINQKPTDWLTDWMYVVCMYLYMYVCMYVYVCMARQTSSFGSDASQMNSTGLVAGSSFIGREI